MISSTWPTTEYFKVWPSEGPHMPRKKDSCGGYQKLVQESINRRIKHGRERSSQGNWVHLFMCNWNLWVFPEKSCCNLHPAHSLPSVLYYVLGHFYFIINLTILYFIHSINLIFYILLLSYLIYFSFLFPFINKIDFFSYKYSNYHFSLPKFFPDTSHLPSYQNPHTFCLFKKTKSHLKTILK